MRLMRVVGRFCEKWTNRVRAYTSLANGACLPPGFAIIPTLYLTQYGVQSPRRNDGVECSAFRCFSTRGVSRNSPILGVEASRNIA
jgi:hypothetical protein